jgi:outer membrane usher protein
VRNDACILLASLLTFSAAARATPGSWFAPSPCPGDAAEQARQSAQPGATQLLSVHYQPDRPPHDVVVKLGVDGLWRVPVDEWQQWTPVTPQVETDTDGERVVALKSGPALALRIDGCTSEMWVDADPGRHHDFDMHRKSPHPVARAGYGGFLNLDLSYGGLNGSHVADAVFDLGVFAPGGAGRSDFFVGSDAIRRLDSFWIHDEPDSAVRLRLGDSITHAADWETAVRFGGLQWGTDFSLQPSRITFPVPTISGSAALASTAQLYVNGVQLAQQPLQPGQFRFDSVPTLTGAGDLSVVIRDSLGRLQTVTQSFYTSPRVLAAGLDADTGEAGFLRVNYASVDDHYTDPFVATTLQHGYGGGFSGLLRASASAHRQLAGLEGDTILSPWGLLTVSGAVSHTESGTGGIGTLAFERQANDLSVTLSRRAATRDYGDLGRDPGTLHFSDTARVALNMHGAGTGSVVYDSEQPWSNTAQGAGIRLVGLSWNVQPARSLTAYVSVLRTLSTLSTPSDLSVLLGFAMTLGRGTSSSVQWTHDGQSGGGANVSIQHSPPQQLGWSYSASGSTQDEGLRLAQAVVTTERGTFGAGWAGIGGAGSPSLVAQTGVAFLDGGAFWTRPVQNSFAVVDTGSAAGVSVYRENQFVGTTDANGRLLVPDLLPFSVNRLSIDDSALPVATGLTSSGEVVSPPANAGVPVRFKVDERPATRIELHQTDGAVVPAGASLWLDGRVLPLPVGYDGLVYAAIADGKHVLEARWDGGACRVRLEILNQQVKMEFCARMAP